LSSFIAARSGGLNRPTAVAFDAQGRAYVSSADTHQVLRYTASGAYSDVFSKVPPGSLSGPGSLQFVPGIGDRYPRDSTRRYRPRAGTWSEPTLSGQGFDIQAIGGGLAVAWYTYEADGRATWYLATGLLANDHFEGELQRFTRNGTTISGVTVGDIELDFTAEDRAQMQWTLDGESGTKSLVHFQTGDSLETQFPTAQWYAPANSGWGFSITRQGNLQVVTSFVFDSAGNPTWALGVGTPNDTEFSMTRLSAPGRCPGCVVGTPPPSSATPVGSVEFDVINATMAAGSIDLQGDGLDWEFPDLDLVILSQTPTKPNGDPLGIQ
jgi:hypothetical protein